MTAGPHDDGLGHWGVRQHQIEPMQREFGQQRRSSFDSRQTHLTAPRVCVTGANSR